MIGAWEVGTHGDVPSITRSQNRTDAPARIMFVGDTHLDSPYADREALKYALDQAVAEDAPIVMLGDVYDAMQGKGDKRANKAALMERYHGRDDYMNAMLEDVSAFLEPYARHIWVMLHGNHDSGITKYHEVDLVRLLALDLNRRGGNIATPGYQSHIALKMRNSTSKNGDLIYGFVSHGAGGAAPQTGGVLSASRRAMWVPFADFVVSGHLHRDWVYSINQLRVSQSGRVYRNRVLHAQVGAWKRETHTAPSYSVEKGMAPVDVGPAYWLEVRLRRGQSRAGSRWALKFVEVDQ